MNYKNEIKNWALFLFWKGYMRGSFPHTYHEFWEQGGWFVFPENVVEEFEKEWEEGMEENLKNAFNSQIWGRENEVGRH